MIKNLSYAVDLLDGIIRKKLLLVLMCFLLLAVLEIFGLSMVLPVLATLVEPGFVDSNPWLSAFYKATGFNSYNNFVYLLLLVMLVSITGKNLGAIFLNRWQFRFLAHAQAEQSKKMYELYMRMPYKEYIKRNTGFFMYVINSASSLLYTSMVQQIIVILTEIATLSFLMIVLVMANPTASLMAITILALCALLIYRVTSIKLKEIGEENRKYSEKAIRQIKESFNGFKEIRVMGSSNKFTCDFNNTMDVLSENRAQQSINIMYTRHIIEIILVLIIVLVTSITISAQDPALAVGQLSLFGIITLRMLPSITRMISSAQIMRTAEAPVKLLKEELDHFKEWEMEPMNPETAKYKVSPVNICMENVSFSYENCDMRAVDNVNLSIPYGEIVGIAGPSGAGKSTLADIILGVIKPDNGIILANGEDIYRDIIQWRKHVAYVPQKITFVSGNVRSNVAFGISEPEICDKKVHQSLKLAQLADRFLSLEDGIFHQMQEDAVNLSGGEKQRLGVARALYHDASILILDEATSSLDVETEFKLTSVINGLRGRCTVIVIAHRLSTLQDCDRIVFMENGKVLDFSDFRTLQETQPGFRRMVELSRINPGHMI